MSLIIWQSTGSLLSNSLQITYCLTIYRSLFEWQSIYPLLFDSLQVPYCSSLLVLYCLTIWQSTCPLLSDSLHVPYCLTVYMSLIVWAYTSLIARVYLSLTAWQSTGLSLIVWQSTGPLLSDSVHDPYWMYKWMSTNMWLWCLKNQAAAY